MPAATRAAVFLDRDDTIVDANAATADLRVPGDLLIPGRVKLLPGAADACRALHQAGFALVITSNQGGVARGMGTLADVEATNDRLRELLASHGVPIAGAYFCPFASSGSVAPFNVDHDWRKPSCGMTSAALAELGLDPAACWAVGDKARDIDAAVAAGLDRERCILIGTTGALNPRAKDLAEAAKIILASA